MGDSPATDWTSKEFNGTKEQRALAMFSEAEQVDQQPENTLQADRDFDLMRMYEQAPITALLPFAGREYNSTGAGVAAVSTLGRPVQISPWNILRAVVNTAWAVITRSKVRGRFITSKGTEAQKRRAKAATHWLDGWAEEAKLHRIGGRCFKDAEIAKWGVAQLYTERNKVKLQRVMPLEITFDFTGAVNGEPTKIFRRTGQSRAKLIAKYAKGPRGPDIRAAILAAGKLEVSGSATASDLILVRESYALPSYPGAGDGWHAVAIEGQQDGCCLVIEEYKRAWWPYVFFTWEDSLTGMGGVSLAAQLETMQTELNFMLYVEQKARRRMLLPRLWVSKGSKIAKNQITNDIGSIIEGTGTPPVALNWAAMHPEHYQAKQDLINKMYEIGGISQNVAAGTKPEGTESGAAQREAQESQNLRIQIYSQLSWEAPIVEIFEKAVEMAAEVVEAGDEYEVQATTNDGVETVNFKDIMHDLKVRKVAIYPSGFLPLTPAARLDYILQMLTSGLWDVDRARQAMSDLDVDSEQTMENSIQQMFVKKFEAMLYEGEPSQPMELDVGYFQIALKTAAVYEAMAYVEKLTEKKPANVSLMRRYVSELKRLKTQLDAANAPPPPAAVAMQQAAPTPGAPVAPLAAVPPIAA